MADGATFVLPTLPKELAKLGLHRGSLVAMFYDDLRGVFRVDAIDTQLRGLRITEQTDIPVMTEAVLDPDFVKHR